MHMHGENLDMYNLSLELMSCEADVLFVFFFQIVEVRCRKLSSQLMMQAFMFQFLFCFTLFRVWFL